jgi:hypothetical protein
MTSKIECESLKNGMCFSIMTNDEAREQRLIGCSNSNIRACCYLCSRYQRCEISCKLLGENSQELRNNQLDATVEDSKILIFKCPSCEIIMVKTKMNLKIGKIEGVSNDLNLDIAETRETPEVNLPVIMHMCPKCGKIDFVVQEKTKQKITDRSKSF